MAETSTVVIMTTITVNASGPLLWEIASGFVLRQPVILVRHAMEGVTRDLRLPNQLLRIYTGNGPSAPQCVCTTYLC